MFTSYTFPKRPFTQILTPTCSLSDKAFHYVHLEKTDIKLTVVIRSKFGPLESSFGRFCPEITAIQKLTLERLL